MGLFLPYFCVGINVTIVVLSTVGTVWLASGVACKWLLWSHSWDRCGTSGKSGKQIHDRKAVHRWWYGARSHWVWVEDCHWGFYSFVTFDNQYVVHVSKARLLPRYDVIIISTNVNFGSGIFSTTDVQLWSWVLHLVCTMWRWGQQWIWRCLIFHVLPFIFLQIEELKSSTNL